ncbi:DUF4198 domain-containing protein [Allofranklinella schreckenbergeri]|uniref:DUF4198 domain-containing protein n=2 Tax=Allofranklinella schreckenbergeri TaxID=1076744 RepID=A0A3M6QGR3_9BURK|nr:DUF4198 domain-containing protein [Allofranklinella schreckenbergeri]
MDESHSHLSLFIEEKEFCMIHFSLRRLPLALALAGAGLLASAAHAHGTWLAHIHGQSTVMYGHDGADTDAYDPAKVIDARAHKNGNAVEAKVVPHEQRYATLEADKPGVLGYTLRSGFWHKGADGKWHNQPRSAAADPAKVEKAMLGVMYSVSYQNAREPVKALGYALEIVPAVNPAKLEEGDKLSVQVLYEGKPLAGAKVSVDFFDHDADQVTTDAEGRAELKVAREGFNVLAVEHSVAHSNKSEADTVNMMASLSFESKHDHDH